MAKSAKLQKLETYTSTTTRSTRSSSEYFLIGHSKETISGSKLPALQVFQYVLYVQEVAPKSQSTKLSISHAVEQVFSFWSMPGIKTIGIQYAEDKLLTIWKKWMGLKKSQHRPTDPEDNFL